VLGGIGSISGSCIAVVLFIFASEWWLRGLDSGTFLGINAPMIFRNGFRLVIFSLIIMSVVLFFRKGIMGDKELPFVAGRLKERLLSWHRLRRVRVAKTGSGLKGGQNG
jgi:branched-chain amino acid transport system permease protein